MFFEVKKIVKKTYWKQYFVVALKDSINSWKISWFQSHQRETHKKNIAKLDKIEKSMMKKKKKTNYGIKKPKNCGAFGFVGKAIKLNC